jgi:hypothetical protein
MPGNCSICNAIDAAIIEYAYNSRGSSIDNHKPIEGIWFKFQPNFATSLLENLVEILVIFAK